MKATLRAVAAVLVLSLATNASAQMRSADMGGHTMTGGPPFGPPAFLSRLFPPKLVMQHQQEIGLTPAQTDVIKKAMNETQTQLVEIQWKLDADSEALDKLLAADHVDETAALAKLDEVIATEQQVKKVNFALLLRIKNQLDAQQQAKLRALRPTMEFGGRFGPGRMMPE